MRLTVMDMMKMKRSKTGTTDLTEDVSTEAPTDPNTSSASSQSSAFVIPKSVKQAREMFSATGGTPTVDNLKNTLGSSDVNKLRGAMTSKMSDATRKIYDKLTSDRERHQWLCNFIVDPEGTQKNGAEFGIHK